MMCRVVAEMCVYINNKVVWEKSLSDVNKIFYISECDDSRGILI